jgi:hypothetical protein
MDNENLIQPIAPGRSIDERLAEIEGTLASSWALRTRDEYEADVRERLKMDLISYVTKLALAALIFLGGVGVLFVKSAIQDVYRAENDKVISDLRGRYDRILTEQNVKFEWKRHHDYAKSYIYFARFYADSEIKNDKIAERIRGQIQKARMYLHFALDQDPTQAISYWELAETYNTYPKEFGDLTDVDLSLALENYSLAAAHYSVADVAKGWRADAYREIGKLYIDRSSSRARVAAAQDDVNLAYTYLQRAREEYQNAIPDSEFDRNAHLREVESLLIPIRNRLEEARPIPLSSP